MERIENRGYQSEPADGSGEVSRPTALFSESLLLLLLMNFLSRCTSVNEALRSIAD
jgi:hypothetical protein